MSKVASSRRARAERGYVIPKVCSRFLKAPFDKVPNCDASNLAVRRRRARAGYVIPKMCSRNLEAAFDNLPASDAIHLVARLSSSFVEGANPSR